MREIKFRAWDVKNKKMIYHFLLTSKGEFVALRDPMTPDGDDYGTMDFELPSSDGIVLMQFTGLHDKNGKVIYERDVMRWLDMYLEVRWGSVGWVLSGPLFKRFESPDGPCRETNTTGYTTKSVVIGNVYENPELIAEKQL